MDDIKNQIISDICPFYKQYGSCERCNTELDICDDTCYYESTDEPCYYERTADSIINNGYRKQSEGEWIEQKRFYASGKILYHYRCSLCGVYLAKRANFCPNCGARMKGGEG